MSFLFSSRHNTLETATAAEANYEAMAPYILFMYGGHGMFMNLSGLKKLTINILVS